MVEKLPSPVAAAEHRLVQLCPGFKQYTMAESTAEPFQDPHVTPVVEDSSVVEERRRVFESLRRCGSADEDRIVVYAAKFLGADLTSLRLTGDKLSGELLEILFDTMIYESVALQVMSVYPILWPSPEF